MHSNDKRISALAHRRPLVLITGCPRSGTTWVADILARAPGTMMLAEPFSPDLSQRPYRVCNVLWKEWFYCVDESNAQEFQPAIEEMLALRHRTWPHLKKCKTAKNATDVLALGLRFRLGRLTTSRSIVKDPLALLSAPWLAREFGAKVIVMIRHPAAVISSFRRLNLCVDIPGLLRQHLAMQRFFEPMRAELEQFVRLEPNIVDTSAMLWKALYFAVVQFRREHPDWLFVRHEDLSQDPLGGFEKICRHIGIEFTPALRKAVLESDDAALPPELDSSLAFTTRRNIKLNVSNWKSRLSADEIERVRRRVQDVSREFYSDQEW
jgi:hypothetical protein